MCDQAYIVYVPISRIHTSNMHVILVPDKKICNTYILLTKGYLNGELRLNAVTPNRNTTQNIVQEVIHRCSMLKR